MKALFFAAVLLTGTAAAGHAFTFPETFFFNYTPQYAYSLVSDKGAKLDVTTFAELPPDETVARDFFMNWVLRLNLGDQKFAWLLRFHVDDKGNASLSEIRDTAQSATLIEDLPIFPAWPDAGPEFRLGANIELKFTKRQASITDEKTGRTFSDILVAEISFGSRVWKVFFAKNTGIVGIKGDTDTFRFRS